MSNIILNMSNIILFYKFGALREISGPSRTKVHIKNRRSISASPENFNLKFLTAIIKKKQVKPITSGQALDLLVAVSCVCYHTSTSALSTSSSSRGLTNLCYGISHLEGGFTLRCLQRLSLPNLATRPCRWYNNRSTRGSSIPVLSY